MQLQSESRDQKPPRMRLMLLPRGEEFRYTHWQKHPPSLSGRHLVYLVTVGLLKVLGKISAYMFIQA